MTDKTDLIREIHEYVTTHGGENTATHLLVQAASVIQTQAAELDAVGAGGVQALSAAPAIGDELRDTLVAVSAAIAERDDRAAQKMIREILAASPTPPAEQQAPNTGHAEGDRLIGRLMSSDPDFEDCRQAAALIQREVKGPDGFWTWREAAIAERLTRVNQQAAPKAAPGEPRQIGVIRFDKHKHPYAVLQTCSDGKGNAWVAETPIYAGQAPQQDAQEPVAWLVPMLQTFKGAERVHFARAPGCTMTDAELTDHMEGRVVWIAKTFSDSPGITDKFGVEHKPKPLYTAPQPAPAPLSDDVVRDAAFEAVRKNLCALPRYSFVLDDDGLIRRVQDRVGNWIEFNEAHALFDPVSIDAARKQGGA